MTELYSAHPPTVKINAPPCASLAPESGSQTRISCEPIVASSSCLDTLRFSLWVDWEHSDFLEHLEIAKKLAQQGDYDSEPVDLGGQSWNVMRSGTSLYSLRLVRGDIKLLINRRKASGNIPTTRFEIGSVSCWSPGFRTIYDEIFQLIGFYGGVVCKERISEVHLASDFIGQELTELPVADMDHWVTRAHDFTPHFSCRKLTGVSVGKGSFMLRVYDKVGELRKSTCKQDLFKNVWGVQTFDEKPVTRVEFQVRRPILRDFAPVINTLEDLENCLDSLWQYCCQKWGRLTTAAVDRNHHQSRAETHPFWCLVQGITWDGSNIVGRVKRYVQKDMLRLTQQATGICMTISAMLKREPDDLEGVIVFSQMAIEDHLRKLYEDKEDFVKRMLRKTNNGLPFESCLADDFQPFNADRLSFNFPEEVTE